jgi:predicted small lipoprotein YifL
MKNIFHFVLLLACLFTIGCGQNGRMVTTTAHQVVQNRNQDEPVGHFEITQTRFQSDGSPWCFDNREYDRGGRSDVVVTFRNTTNRVINLNFILTGRGWCVKDAVVALKPDSVYTTQRINVPYNALDYWRLSTTDITFNKD